MKQLFFFPLLMVFFYSCETKTIYSHVETLEGPWKYNQNVNFEYEIKDVTIPYNLILGVTHASDFSYENIYVNVTTIFPDGKKTSSPVSLQLADEHGEWQGKCANDECKVMIEMSTNAYFEKPGKYQLIFEQYSRNEAIEGIKSLEVSIKASETNK